jgi:electron transport complex protein RnfE
VDGICQGLGYTLVLLAMCIVRELLGAGTLAGVQIMPAGYQTIGVLTLPVGGFMALGALIAAMQWALNRPKKAAKEGK